MVSIFGSNNQYLESVAQNVASNIGFKKCNVIFEKCVGKGSGYLGDIYRVTIIGFKGGDKSTLHLIAKLVSPNERKREVASLEYFFAIEAHMYKNVLPELESIQLHARTKFKRPMCYAVKNERFKEMILMEDITTRKYEKSRLIGLDLDYDHAILVVEEIARFHALSMVYRHRYPEKFKELAKWVPETKIFKITQKTIFDGAVKYAIDNVQSKSFQDLIEQYQRQAPYEKFRYQNNGNNYYSTAVVTHGDLWINNFTFKYKGDRPVSVMLLDYQISKLASPVCDLYFLLFIAVNEEVRKRRFQELLSIYYDGLCRYIEDLGGKSDDLYPESVFREDLKKFSFAGMTYAMYMLPIFTGKPQDVEAAFARLLDPGEDFVLGSPVPSELYIRRIEQMAEDIQTHNLNELWSVDTIRSN